MDFTDANPFDVELARADIRRGIARSIMLGLLGVAVAAGGFAFDRYTSPDEQAATVTLASR